MASISNTSREYPMMHVCCKFWDSSLNLWSSSHCHDFPDSKVHGANMGPTWALSAPCGPHVGPINLAIRDSLSRHGRHQANTQINTKHYSDVTWALWRTKSRQLDRLFNSTHRLTTNTLQISVTLLRKMLPWHIKSSWSNQTCSIIRSRYLAITVLQNNVTIFSSEGDILDVFLFVKNLSLRCSTAGNTWCATYRDSIYID